jgi:hypothetical protein
MDRQREELRAWFASNPHGTPDHAVRELDYSHPDHMCVVADSVRIDMLREHQIPCNTASPRR